MIPVTTTVSGVFSEAVQQGTITFRLKDAGDNVVPSTTAYNATTRTVTLTPTAPLASSTTYTASVRAKDTFGNQMVTAFTWTFRT